ncbi:MAG: MoaD/ThiS family protein [Actinomycetes bacterium]
MALIEVHFYAGAAEAAGTKLQSCRANSLEQLFANLSHEHGDGLRRVLDVSSVLIDGVAHRSGGAAFWSDCRVDVLPPYAGG